jgi:hypothetical protein
MVSRLLSQPQLLLPLFFLIWLLQPYLPLLLRPSLHTHLRGQATTPTGFRTRLSARPFRLPCPSATPTQHRLGHLHHSLGALHHRSRPHSWAPAVLTHRVSTRAGFLLLWQLVDEEGTQALRERVVVVVLQWHLRAFGPLLHRLIGASAAPRVKSRFRSQSWFIHLHWYDAAPAPPSPKLIILQACVAMVVYEHIWEVFIEGLDRYGLCLDVTVPLNTPWESVSRYTASQLINGPFAYQFPAGYSTNDIFQRVPIFAMGANRAGAARSQSSTPRMRLRREYLPAGMPLSELPPSFKVPGACFLDTSPSTSRLIIHTGENFVLPHVHVTQHHPSGMAGPSFHLVSFMFEGTRHNCISTRIYSQFPEDGVIVEDIDECSCDEEEGRPRQRVRLFSPEPAPETPSIPAPTSSLPALSAHHITTNVNNHPVHAVSALASHPGPPYADLESVYRLNLFLHTLSEFSVNMQNLRRLCGQTALRELHQHLSIMMHYSTRLTPAMNCLSVLYLASLPFLRLTSVQAPRKKQRSFLTPFSLCVLLPVTTRSSCLRKMS